MKKRPTKRSKAVKKTSSPAIESSVSVHECPPRHEGVLPIPYMIAVLSAAAQGAVVETRLSCGAWRVDNKPIWAWFGNDYRIKSDVRGESRPLFISPIAPGHNPAKLTVEQVGNGYRLLTWEEVSEGHRRDHRADIHTWTSAIWYPNTRGCDFIQTYRTNLSPCLLASLIKPKKVPLTMDDIPAVCWIRGPHSGSSSYLVTSISAVGVSLGGRDLGDYYNPLFRQLQSDDWEYSTDRKIWYKCEKEAN